MNRLGAEQTKEPRTSPSGRFDAQPISSCWGDGFLIAESDNYDLLFVRNHSDLLDLIALLTQLKEPTNVPVTQ